MLGAIIGDIVGSVYEFDNIKTKSFPLFASYKSYTDDSILAIATADWLLHGGNPEDYYFKYAIKYDQPMGGYGSRFWDWVEEGKSGKRLVPYYSCGNGSAMRIAPVGWLSSKVPFRSEKLVLDYSKKSAECTHNHPEGIKGAQATALCIYLARKGTPPMIIRKSIESKFGYDLSLDVDEIRSRYSWGGLDNEGNGGTCQGSVPQAIICALEANDFEDAIRNAISIGGDSDTIGCITGGISEALYGIPEHIRREGMSFLSDELKLIVDEFEGKYGAK